METLNHFIARLEKDIPCYSNKRVKPKGIPLNKCNTTVLREKGHFATAHDYPSNKGFRIVAKERLCDSWCISIGKFKKDAFGIGYHGREFYVDYDSYHSDYHIALKAVRIVRNSPLLSTCED